MSNRLASEKSPYLLQHKENPVDWWPWGPEAFAAAHKADRPIFLSIGYATCHWCHVMEKESFEDAEVARLLNETFVNIKVDREERPDIDAIYMNACQIATGRGGWPLTIMMTPAMHPFFAGTYLPKTERYGHEGMLQIIPKVAEAWQKNRHQLQSIADGFVKALGESATLDLSGDKLSEETLHRAFQSLEQQFDPVHGGIGGAPKFPSPERLRFLLRYWYRTGNSRALSIVEHTLQNMRRGGLYDQLGGGFHRYSTDALWRVPHFEKMLYDQALLILVYLEAFQITGKLEYAQTVRTTLEYVHRELETEEGAYCTGEDADSEGVEGAYYVWDLKQVREILSPDEAKTFAAIFNLEKAGNYLDEASRKKTGKNILYRYAGDPLEDDERLTQSCRKLLQHRSGRIRPLLDDKILTDWNGLMIAALARSAMVLEDQDYIRRAQACIEFIQEKLMPRTGQLLHRWREGEAMISGMLDDYAYMIMGLLALFEATDHGKYCELAVALIRTVLDEFRSEHGDFYMVAKDAESLLLRPRQSFDSAIPSGNAVMIMNLFRLARITGNTEFEAAGHQSIQSYSAGLSNYPDAFSAALSALDYVLGPSTEIIVSGPREQLKTQSTCSSLRKVYAPNAIILSRQEFGGMSSHGIHICHGNTCELSTQDLQAVIARITKSGSNAGVQP